MIDDCVTLEPRSHPVCVGKRVPGRISVIIPALNEQARIASAIRSAQGGGDVEIIVVDGHSTDDTAGVARSCGVTVLMTSPPGRARQMNAGAAQATGQWLLFLHADTLLPPAYDRCIRRLLSEQGIVGGAFCLKIDTPGWFLRFLEKTVNLRSRWLGRPYGDQGIFLAAELFERLEGYADLPIMEDFVLIGRLRRYGRVCVASKPVVTSGRRWANKGVFRATLLNQIVTVAYCLGVSPRRLAQWRS